MTEQQHPEWMGKNRKLTPAEVKEFLAAPVVARIATIDESGVPYVTPVWQEWDGEAFWIVPRERAAWIAHIKKNPNVGISCAEDNGT
jgi:nitroimidazol reductase NimA-like FMN-containing flavoprotein (pyridoxamine 5'-phosphate oxidase superfamily)